jgi:hypothetical protein
MVDTLFVKGLGTLGPTIGDTPDLRLMLLTLATFDVDAIHLDDITFVEFAGVGYTTYDAAGVSVAYDDTSHELYIDFTDGASIWGATVAADADDIVGCLAVVGDPATPSTCILCGFTEEIVGNANGGTLGATFPDRWLHLVQA